MNIKRFPRVGELVYLKTLKFDDDGKLICTQDTWIDHSGKPIASIIKKIIGPTYIVYRKSNHSSTHTCQRERIILI